MNGPSWLADTFAVVMIVTAVYCVSRLVASRRSRRPTERDVDTVHVFMGVAMAGMLVPRLNPVADSGWEVIFGAAAAWFGWQVLRPRRGADTSGHRPAHHLPHLLASAAMLYMLLAVSAVRTAGATRPISMGGAVGGAARYPTLTLAFAVALLGYVIWTTDKLPSRLPAAASGTQPAGRLPISPRLAACCEIAMGVTMGYVLVLML